MLGFKRASKLELLLSVLFISLIVEINNLVQLSQLVKQFKDSNSTWRWAYEKNARGAGIP